MGTSALRDYQTNIKKFKELDKSKMGLEPGEQIAHCIDSKSFGGKFYYPQWVVTNKGRVWSMKYNKWMVPQILKGDNNSYWGLTPKEKGSSKSMSVYIHLLVCNYFKNESDKIALEFFGEDNVHGHHIQAIDIPKSLKGRGHEEEKIKRCMKDSCKKNIVYQEKSSDHIDDTTLANGGLPKKQIWSDAAKEEQKILYNSGQLEGNSYGTYYIYSKDENGNLKKNLWHRTDVKSLLSKNDVIIGEYKLNADKNQKFIVENQDLILSQIKQDPPINTEYVKKLKINNIDIFYALK